MLEMKNKWAALYSKDFTGFLIARVMKRTAITKSSETKGWWLPVLPPMGNLHPTDPAPDPVLLSFANWPMSHFLRFPSKQYPPEIGNQAILIHPGVFFYLLFFCLFNLEKLLSFAFSWGEFFSVCSDLPHMFEIRFCFRTWEGNSTCLLLNGLFWNEMFSLKWKSTSKYFSITAYGFDVIVPLYWLKIIYKLRWRI